MRAELLPAPYDSICRKQIGEYVALRIQVSAIDLTQAKEREKLNIETEHIQNLIWNKAIRASAINARPVTTGYFITSLNETFEARSARNALLMRHVPESTLLLLFFVFIIVGGLMGYSSGLSLQRALIPTVIFNLHIGLVVFIIIDLDRPKRGFIQVKQDMLFELIEPPKPI